MRNTFLPFCKPDQKTQIRKLLHNISEHNISYLHSWPFVDIVELQNDISDRPNNTRGTTRANVKVCLANNYI